MSKEVLETQFLEEEPKQPDWMKREREKVKEKETRLHEQELAEKILEWSRRADAMDSQRPEQILGAESLFEEVLGQALDMAAEGEVTDLVTEVRRYRHSADLSEAEQLVALARRILDTKETP